MVTQTNKNTLTPELQEVWKTVSFSRDRDYAVQFLREIFNSKSFTLETLHSALSSSQIRGFLDAIQMQEIMPNNITAKPVKKRIRLSSDEKKVICDGILAILKANPKGLKRVDIVGQLEKSGKEVSSSQVATFLGELKKGKKIKSSGIKSKTVWLPV